MRNLIYLLLSVSIFISCGQSIKHENDISSPKWVNDNAELLTPEEDSILTKKLQKLEDSIGSQLVILIIDTLDGRKIENYSLDIAESWKIGRANYNDGILMLFAMKDRQVRIEVGYGLENIIRDEIADKIIRELINPEFKIKNYYIGISNSIDSISNLIYSHQELIGTKPKW